jgi:acyl carrier protein
MASEPEQLKITICELISDIAPDVDTDKLDPTVDMRDELDLDSMDFLRLLEAISAKLGVNIPEGDYQKVNSLQAMADYIAARC